MGSAVGCKLVDFALFNKLAVKLMFSRLMPKEGKFFELFNAHAELVVQGVRQLSALVADVGSGSEVLARHAQSIDEIETRADKITHDAMALLHTVFTTPINRDEIHQLVTSMDDILDLIQDVGESMYLYDVRQLSEEARRLTDICVSCCERVKTAVSLLGDMNHAQAILRTCEEIDQLESDADRVMRQGMAKIFREEADVRQLIKLKGIYELLESVTDRCEDVANIIEGIVLENS